MQAQNIYPRHTHDLSRRDMVCLHSVAKQRSRPSVGGSSACADGIPCTSILI
jgi:hypothetical protein